MAVVIASCEGKNELMTSHPKCSCCPHFLKGHNSLEEHQSAITQSMIHAHLRPVNATKLSMPTITCPAQLGSHASQFILFTNQGFSSSSASLNLLLRQREMARAASCIALASVISSTAVDGLGSSCEDKAS